MTNNFADVYRQQVLDMMHGATPGASRKGLMSLLETLEKREAQQEGQGQEEVLPEEEEASREEIVVSSLVYDDESASLEVVRSVSEEEDDHTHVWF